MLQAKVENASYNNEITLSFKHQLAKVRVVLDGTQAFDVTKVEVNNYTQCTHTQGTVTGTQTGWITMHKVDATTYEANVVPCTTIPNDFIRVNDQTATVSGITTLTQGEVHTIDLTVGIGEIDLSTYEDNTLTVGGKVTIKGDGSQAKNLQITVEDGAEVTLDNVVLQPSAFGNTITCKGDATLILTGNNSLKATSCYWNSILGSGIYVESGTLTIDGNGSLDISRDHELSYRQVGAGIGAGNGANIVIENGNITIGKIPSLNEQSGAGIGSLFQEQCGDITITGGNITIEEQYVSTACIGSSGLGSCGDITISGENTVITFTKGQSAPCGIGNGAYGTCGTVTVGGGATVNGVKYTETHTGVL